MAFNTPESVLLKTADGQRLQVEKDFKYIGSYINSSEKDIKVGKALAWNVLHSMHVIWKFKINLPLKRRLFVATVENVLTYRSESWTLTIQKQKSLDGTLMLRKALTIPWQEHSINKNAYGKLPLVSSQIKSRRMRMAGHCIRHPELSTYPLILWESTQGKANRGRRRLNNVDVLKKDTGLLEKEEIRTSMLNRDIWRKLTHTDARVDDEDHPRN